MLCCLTKKSKLSEQAYLALHIAWIYRDLEDETNELAFLERDFEGFSAALGSERFPEIGRASCRERVCSPV